MARDGLTLSILLLGGALVSACNSAPKPAEAREADAAKAETPTAAPAPSEAPSAAPKAEAAPEGPVSGEIPMAPPPPIPPAPTPEELKMLELDPKDLTPDERRKRARIRYRQIMQDPESPQAQVIRQAQAQMFQQAPPQDGSGTKPAKQNNSGLILHAPQESYPMPKDQPAKPAAAQDG